jgi:hypothetical protein
MSAYPPPPFFILSAVIIEKTPVSVNERKTPADDPQV